MPHHLPVSCLHKGAYSSAFSQVWFLIGACSGLEACLLLRLIPKVLVVKLLNLVQQGFCNDSEYAVIPPVEP